MIKYVNIIRYLISIVVPVVMLITGFDYSLIITMIVLLLLNNTLDDVLFYLGNVEVGTGLYRGGLISPVNGVVTKIEHNVCLFNNISKKDALTNEIIFSPCIGKRNKKYNHIAIFLNKLNHHIVVNPFEIKKIIKHYADGSNHEMVIDGQLVSDNKGCYLNNDSLIIDYGKYVVVITLDKYISEYEYICGESKKVGIIICKGSQCDIYAPKEEKFECKEGDVLNIYQTLIKGDIEDINIDKSHIKQVVNTGIKHSGGILGIVVDNIKKTLCTFANIDILSLFAGGLVLSLFTEHCIYISIFILFCFVVERFYKNLMYSIMNIIGLRNWMQKSYSYINKVSLLWKRR